MRRWLANPLAARFCQGGPFVVGAHWISSWRRQGANATNTAPWALTTASGASHCVSAWRKTCTIRLKCCRSQQPAPTIARLYPAKISTLESQGPAIWTRYRRSTHQTWGGAVAALGRAAGVGTRGSRGGPGGACLYRATICQTVVWP